MDKAKIQLSTCNSKLSSVCCVKTNHKKGTWWFSWTDCYLCYSIIYNNSITWLLYIDPAEKMFRQNHNIIWVL